MPKLTSYQESMRKNDFVQSILLSKSYYDLVDACAMVRYIGYNCFYIDETKGYYRVRQFNPKLLSKKPKYKTTSSDKYPGLSFVIEY